MTINTLPSPTSSSIAENQIGELQSRLQGKVIQPLDSEFSVLSQPWNLSVQQNPALVVIVKNQSDVQAAVRFARQIGLGIAVQGSGHGNVRPADEALLIHTREMKAVEVDKESMTAWVESGAKWGEVLQVTQSVGLAPLLGSSPDVGIAGYTLGGGMGWLGRKYGLAADSVLDFELVTAQGELILANPENHPDLYWGLRGGGGSLGIVTRFHIKLFPVSEVYAGNLYYPIEDAKEVFKRFREWVKSVPEELTSAIVIMNYPPIPVMPEFLRGKSFVIVRGCYTGNLDEGEMLLKSWRDWRSPAIDDVKPLPFAQVAAISNDPVDPVRSSSTGFYLREISDELIETLNKTTTAAHGSPITVTEIRHLGGAIARVDQHSAAFGHREAKFSIQMIGAIPTPEAHNRLTIVTSEIKEALSLDLSGGVYLNFLDGDEVTRRVKDGYSNESFQRLRELKGKYDPENLLRFSYPIEPAA